MWVVFNNIHKISVMYSTLWHSDCQRELNWGDINAKNSLYVNRCITAKNTAMICKVVLIRLVATL